MYKQCQNGCNFCFKMLSNIVNKSYEMSYKTYTGSRIFITYIESDDRNTLSFYVAIIQLMDNEFERITK